MNKTLKTAAAVLTGVFLITGCVPKNTKVEQQPKTVKAKKNRYIYINVTSNPVKIIDIETAQTKKDMLKTVSKRVVANLKFKEKVTGKKDISLNEENVKVILMPAVDSAAVDYINKHTADGSIKITKAYKGGKTFNYQVKIPVNEDEFVYLTKLYMKEYYKDQINKNDTLKEVYNLLF